MGGGTVVMAQINEGRLFPLKAMSLRRAGMDELRATDGQIQIGAATTIARISRIEELPILAQAAGMLGGPALRTMATIGGNMFMPAPYADLAVPLLALDAQVELAGPGGSRALALDQFFSASGPSLCAADELLTGFSVPLPVGRKRLLALWPTHGQHPGGGGGGRARGDRC